MCALPKFADAAAADSSTSSDTTPVPLAMITEAMVVRSGCCEGHAGRLQTEFYYGVGLGREHTCAGIPMLDSQRLAGSTETDRLPHGKPSMIAKAADNKGGRFGSAAEFSAVI